MRILFQARLRLSAYKPQTPDPEKQDPEIEKYINLESLTIAQVEYLLRFTSFNRFLDLHYQRTHKNLFSK